MLALLIPDFFEERQHLRNPGLNKNYWCRTIGAGHNFITLHPLLEILVLGLWVPVQDSALSYFVMTGT